MNIIITAGGTAEKIDDVRHLTNQATGRLGQHIAAAFDHEPVHIFYIYGPRAVLPEGENITFLPIHSVRDLLHTMKQILTTEAIDYVIHSMAVSDYELDAATNERDLAEQLATRITQLEHPTKEEINDIIIQTLTTPKLLPGQTQKKISSTSDELILLLGKAPKVIAHIKEWQPSTTLIGFKLLVDVSEEELVRVAQDSIRKNNADFILANDLEHINDTEHIGLLVSKKGVEQRFSTKQDIAFGLKQLIMPS